MGLAPGSRLGQYEILAPLGAGGMGEVYRARDARLGREVALKILPGGVAGEPSRLARFEREARLLAALNHPGIAAVYGFEDHGDTPFIIMELVPGETLTERMVGGPVPLRDALQLARQIAEALESAHERGVVHRDLKPGNIKVTPEGKVKVLDLGLAKAFDVKSSSSEDMSQSPTLEQTRPGVILGTAEFMSPEQARGKPVDKRSDIWAFGCIVYEMLAGRRAFTGETVSDVLAAILSTEPDWRALPLDTPPAVRELLARCLRKDQNRRLRDIGEGRITIEEAIAGLDGPPRESRPERSRWTRAALIAVPILLLAVLAGWYALRSRGSRADSMAASAAAGIPDRKYLAVLPFKELSRRPDGQLIGDGFAETVSVRIAKIPGVQVVPPASATAAAGRHADPYEVAKALRATLLVHGAVQQEGEQVRVTFFVNRAGDRTQIMADGITGPAADLFALQDRVAEKIAGSLNLPQPPAAGPSGLGGADQRSYLKAVGLLQRYEKQTSVEEAVRILESMGGSSARTAIVPATLGRAYLLLYDLTKDRAWTDRAIAACEAATRLDQELPEVHVTLGALYHRTGKADDAVAEFERALKLQPSNADALIGLGDAHRAAGRFAEAVTSYRSAIASQPGYWSGYSKLGALYFQRAQYDRAAEQFQEVIALTPDNSRAFQNLGSVYLFLERMDDARAAYEKALALQPTSVGYSNLGTLEFYVGNYPAAARNFEKAVETTPGNYQLWANLGDAYRWAPGMRPRARGAYEKAVAVVREALAVNPNDAAVHANLAAVYAKMGEPGEASRQISRALQLDPRSTQTMYKAAVVAAVAGRRREAVDWIQQAVNAGYSRSQIQRDPEFAAFHDDPAFREALKEVS